MNDHNIWSVKKEQKFCRNYQIILELSTNMSFIKAQLAFSKLFEFQKYEELKLKKKATIPSVLTDEALQVPSLNAFFLTSQLE